MERIICNTIGIILLVLGICLAIMIPLDKHQIIWTTDKIILVGGTILAAIALGLRLIYVGTQHLRNQHH